MAAKRAPTTQHRLTLKKLSDILTTTHTYISTGGGSGNRNNKISQVVNRNDPLRGAYFMAECRAKIRNTELCNHL